MLVVSLLPGHRDSVLVLVLYDCCCIRSGSSVVSSNILCYAQSMSFVMQVRSLIRNGSARESIVSGSFCVSNEQTELRCTRERQVAAVAPYLSLPSEPSRSE